MSVRPGTPLQRAPATLVALVRSSRDGLTDDEYRAFVADGLAVFVHEGDRLTLGEALRALRERER